MKITPIYARRLPKFLGGSDLLIYCRAKARKAATRQQRIHFFSSFYCVGTGGPMTSANAY
jgi:hypothetical protein